MFWSKVQGPNGSKNLVVLPDFGADITAADVKTLRQIGEGVNNLLPPRKEPAFSVDVSAMHSLGQMAVRITLGDVSTEKALHVFPSIPGGILMSWKQARSQKFAMGGCVGGLGAESPAAGGQQESGGKAPSCQRLGVWEQSPEPPEVRGFWGGAPSARKFCIYCKNNVILELF